MLKVLPLMQFVQDCNMADLKDKGAYYTWNNKHDVGSKVYSRIGRVLCNDEWMDCFPGSYVHFMPEVMFDHYPCLIRFKEEIQRRGKTFKYLNMWSFSSEFEDVVRKGWKILVHDPLNEKVCTAEKAYTEELGVLLKARELFLRQKAKRDWLHHGDDNTKYLHASIKNRRARNRVCDKLCSTPEENKSAFEEYYKSLLGTSQEVRIAMFDISGNKAPGPDGYNSQFFKDAWEVVGPEVGEAVRSVFESGALLKQCNNTIITLVPKVDMPESVLQFRFIAYCNTIYKCLSKELCNRLSQVLPDIVSPSQSAFIKDSEDPDAMCFYTILFYIFEWGGVWFLQGQERTKAGDPLSPLVFTISLDYLSRILEVIQQHQHFRYHPLCQRIKLSHLCFPDDLIMFCKGDKSSIKLLLNSFDYFSKASGLVMNREKSNIYFNGTDEQLIKEVEIATGMKRGKVPFKYLRRENPPLVSWDSIFQPRRQGGLGIKRYHEWNVAAIGKYTLRMDHGKIINLLLLPAGLGGKFAR
ncbi:uncharacterized protein LOC141601619 [Silene latifolia]|uniref:uncharacterized protein LOC141601619 n=1 Tax=Silene latifolia TaxID=37657 RepID=UPI003D77D803